MHRRYSCTAQLHRTAAPQVQLHRTRYSCTARGSHVKSHYKRPPRPRCSRPASTVALQAATDLAGSLQAHMEPHCVIACKYAVPGSVKNMQSETHTSFIPFCLLCLLSLLGCPLCVQHVCGAPPLCTVQNSAAQGSPRAYNTMICKRVPGILYMTLCLRDPGLCSVRALHAVLLLPQPCHFVVCGLTASLAVQLTGLWLVRRWVCGRSLPARMDL